MPLSNVGPVPAAADTLADIADAAPVRATSARVLGRRSPFGSGGATPTAADSALSAEAVDPSPGWSAGSSLSLPEAVCPEVGPSSRVAASSALNRSWKSPAPSDGADLADGLERGAWSASTAGLEVSIGTSTCSDALISANTYRFFTGIGQTGIDKNTESAMIDPISPSAPSARQAPGPDEVELRRVAAELEASFLAEMLASAGLGDTPEAFGGGVGEEQFASLLRQEQARQMVAAGGIGLAESIFDALMARQDG